MTVPAPLVDAFFRQAVRAVRTGALAALFVGVLCSTLVGQERGIIDKRLVLSVQPEFGIARAHAPVTTTVSLRWDSSELIEGRLQLDWYVNTIRLGRYVSGELALSDSTIRLNVQLPPVMLSSDDAVVSVQGRFITDETVYDLDEHDLALQPDWRRILVVGVCTTARPPEATAVRLEGGHRFNPLHETFRLQPFFENRFTRRELLVEPAEVDPDDVPVDPLKMTAFDLFVIPADSLARLKPRQLESLLTWTRAGGSLCVLVDSAIPPTHLEWLNRLAGGDLADAAYLRGPDDHVLAARSNADDVYRHELDLGRVVIALKGSDLSDDVWKETALFLWKVRADQTQAAVDGRLWTVRATPFHDGTGMYANLEPQRINGRAELEKMLLPESVRGLPLGAVSLMLVLFLLLIAPGDYLLLGWLKRRRWTWVLFPVLSLAFTGYTMWMARQHLGRTTYHHSITVIDLGDDGTPVRTSRFEMLYPASTRTVTDELEGQMMVPLDPNNDRLVGQYGPPAAREYEQPWTYSGRVPQHYTVEREVQQWAPRLARVTSFGGEAPAQVTQADDSPTTVFRTWKDGHEMMQADDRISTTMTELARGITCRRESGFFSIVSQVSPTAAGNWEDLTLLDSSDPAQTAILEIRNPAEGEYVITRQLERKQD